MLSTSESTRREEDAPRFFTEHSLRAAGRKDGRDNQPPSNQYDLTPIEQALISRSHDELRRLNFGVAQRTQNIESEFRRVGRVESLPDFSSITDETIAELARAKTEAKSELTALRRRERELRRDLNLFKRENALTRAAAIPESLRLHVSILLAVLLVESALNMYFFALGSDFGLLGGFLQALVLSAVNVGLGFLFGYGLVRNAFHISIPRRVGGIAALVVFWTIAVGINLIAAQYRDLLEVAPGQALQQAVPQALSAPLDLTLNALILLLVGMVSAAVGLFEGIWIDEFYPGYGPVFRRYRDALHDYESREREFKRAVVEIASSVQQKGEALFAQTEERVSRLEDLRAAIRSEYDVYASERAALQDECHRQLRAYREENAAVRTARVPSYFGRFPELSSYREQAKVDELSEILSAMKERAAAQRGELAGLRRELAGRIESEAEAFDKLVDELANAVSVRELLDSDFGSQGV